MKTDMLDPISDNEISESFYKPITQIQDFALEQINLIVNNNETEVARVKRTFERVVFEANIEFLDKAPKLPLFISDEHSWKHDKEATLIEGFLSAALYLSMLSWDSFKQNDLYEAFSLFSLASEMFGAAQGHKIQENINGANRNQIDCLNEMISRYQRGPKKKSMESQMSWDLAKQYFAEEIPKHRTLKLAREAAASKAGITANERRLIEMLPAKK